MEIKNPMKKKKLHGGEKEGEKDLLEKLSYLYTTLNVENGKRTFLIYTFPLCRHAHALILESS